MKRIIPIALASSLTLGFAALALAGPHHGPGRAGGPGRIVQLDTNKDGKVTRQEARTAAVARFKALDANKDGVVSREEAAQAKERQHAQRAADRFARMDKNKDGRLSKTEVKMPPARFQKLDANKDGWLTPAELAAGKKERVEKREHKGNGHGMWARQDTNQDGKLTEQEATAAADRMFDRADANRDGILTGDEMQRGYKHGPKSHGRDGQRGQRQRQPKAS
jgi:Ca2+-binding EF-hand superfamily protein